MYFLRGKTCWSADLERHSMDSPRKSTPEYGTDQGASSLGGLFFLITTILLVMLCLGCGKSDGGDSPVDSGNVTCFSTSSRSLFQRMLAASWFNASGSSARMILVSAGQHRSLRCGDRESRPREHPVSVFEKSSFCRKSIQEHVYREVQKENPYAHV